MKKFLLLSFIVLIFVACNKKNTNTPDDVKQNVLTPAAFDDDSAFSFVKSQTDFGPRVPNTDAHLQCGRYLENKLRDYCDTVFVQHFVARAYDGTKLVSTNFIGSFSPERETRILLAAHWDSRPVADHDPDPGKRLQPIDGANDGASGVGVLLEIARQLQMENPKVGVDIIFFDSEDYGTPSGENIPGEWWGLGAQYWSKNNHVVNYYAKYGILLDMVGASDATFRHEGFSSYYAQDIVSKVWSTAYRLNYGSYFINEPAHPVTDDHYYVNCNTKIRMIDVIHQDETSGTGFCPIWHTTQDDIHHIDKKTLGVVGRTLLTLLYEEY